MILRLEPGITHPIEMVGGKACGLARLLDAGLPVPEAWCIPAPISLDELARTTLLDAALPRWWNEVTDLHPDSIWAVRSSAVAEDLADASFAGIYETVLGVASLDDLRVAVRTCWTALDSTRAAAYRKGMSQDGDAGIALVLQRMVRPQTAGVLLTANPQRPFADELVIDASWGLGEAVVSGKVDPDHIVLERSTGIVRQTRVGSKQLELTWDGQRVTESPIADDRADRACLSADDIRALAGLARIATAHLGNGRDLEWAIEDGKLYALQDRPIIGLPNPNPTNVWTRVFGDEYLAGCGRPLASELLMPWLVETQFREMARLQGRHDLAAMEPLRSHKGYAYFSGDYVVAMLRGIPRSRRSTSVNDWFTPLWQRRILEARWDPRMLPGLLVAPLRDWRRGLPWTNPKSMEQHCAHIDEIVVPRLSQDYGALSEDQWQQQLDEAIALGHEHFRLLRWGMGVHNAALHAALEHSLRGWCGDVDGSLYQDIISGLTQTHTARINREIRDLADHARRDSSVEHGLLTSSDRASIREATPDASFWTELDGFLRRHGHRSSSRDIADPRWREEPAVVLGLVRAQLQVRPGSGEHEPRMRERRLAAEQEAVRRLGVGPAGLLRRPALRWLMRMTQEYTCYRENQRYHLDYLLTQVRSLVREQGRRLVTRGALADVDDVFLLELDELRALRTGAPAPEGLADAIGARRDEWLRNKDRLPATYLFDEVETEGEVREGDAADDQADHATAGVGVSRGTARGTARVLTSQAQLADVQAGEILVASTIDPAWTSVFPLIAGLVTETGGALSHGALLAREYGVPTVSGARGATATIVTGDVLFIDGTTGEVVMIDESSEPAAAAG